MIASKVGDGAAWKKRLLFRGMYVAGILNCGKRQRLKKNGSVVFYLGRFDVCPKHS